MEKIYGDLVQFTEETKKLMSERRQGKAVYFKPIICFKNNNERIEFESINLAAQYLGIGRRSISNALTGRSKTAGGHRFEYKESSNV